MEEPQTGRNIAIVRELYESFADPARRNEAFEVFDPEIVWLTSDARQASLDVDAESHGHEGVRRFWRAWLEAWETVELEVESTYAIGSTVVAFHRQQVRGRTTGIEHEVADANIWTFEKGLVARFEIVSDREEALRRAGFDLEHQRVMDVGYDGWNRRDFEAFAATFQPDAEFASQLEAVGGGGYAGRDELRRFWEDVEDTFGQVNLERRDHEDLGDGWSLVTGEGRGRGRESGAEVEFPFAHLSHWRGGLVDWFRAAPSRDEALQAWREARA